MKCFLDGMWHGEEGKRAGAVPRPNRFREPSRLQLQNTPVLIREVCTWPGRPWKVWKGGLAWGKLAMLTLFFSGSIRRKAKGKAGRSKPATYWLTKCWTFRAYAFSAGCPAPVLCFKREISWVEWLWVPASNPEENFTWWQFHCKAVILNLSGNDWVETKHRLLEKPLTSLSKCNSPFQVYPNCQTD